ncbi:hypothetical protein FQR65_LT15187 [Abscondita terminalis]|nr:hypothetical protein FQR65_LT15187 [Abscondita terminalis]
MGSLLYDCGKKKADFLIKPGIFNNTIPGYAIRAKSKSKDGTVLNELMIYDHTSGSSSNNVLLAKEGFVQNSPDNSYMVLSKDEFHRNSHWQSPVLLFGIGAPLGAIIRKGGLGLPVVMAIIFFLIYPSYLRCHEKAAKDASLAPMTDDEDRENEGDFVTAARNATPEIINFMATHGREEGLNMPQNIGDFQLKAYTPKRYRRTAFSPLQQENGKKMKPILVPCTQFMYDRRHLRIHVVVDCEAFQLHKAMEMIQQEGKGVIVYMNPRKAEESALSNKLHALLNLRKQV